MWTWPKVFFVLGAVLVGTGLQTLAVVGFAEMHDATARGYRDLSTLLSWQGVRNVGWGYLAITGVGTIVMGWTAARYGAQVGWWFLASLLAIWGLGLGAVWGLAQAALVSLEPGLVVTMATPGHLCGVAAIAIRVVLEGREEE